MKKRYHITSTDEGWKMKLENSKRASIVADTKEEVLTAGIKIAKNQTEAEIIVHKMDGKFQEERTYPRISDPRKTKG